MNLKSIFLCRLRHVAFPSLRTYAKTARHEKAFEFLSFGAGIHVLARREILDEIVFSWESCVPAQQNGCQFKALASCVCSWITIHMQGVAVRVRARLRQGMFARRQLSLVSSTTDR